jgi:hypothetical protein
MKIAIEPASEDCPHGSPQEGRRRTDDDDSISRLAEGPPIIGKGVAQTGCLNKIISKSVSYIKHIFLVKETHNESVHYQRFDQMQSFCSTQEGQISPPGPTLNKIQVITVI